MDVLSFLLAFIIGTTLGLVGGGGSILTVPVLVYIAGIEPVAATAYSLFIVGITSLVGSVDYASRKLIDYKTAFYFAIPSFIAVYFTRLYIMPAIPAQFWGIEKGLAIMVLFSILMIGAAYSMITSKCDVQWEEETQAISYNIPLMIIEGIVVGVLTGLVGAGGGFLIIPALVLLAKLPMKLAVGTSLVIIAAKSLFGFVGDIQAGIVINWNYLLLFAAFTIVGIFAGSYLSRKINPCKLRHSFGWFVIVMAAFILLKEFFLK
jgi:uncharacterized protein